MENQFTKTNTIHFNDGVIDVSFIEEFALAVFCSEDAQAATVRFDDNLFCGESDLVQAYKDVYESNPFCVEEEEERHVEQFRNWLKQFEIEE